MILESLDCSNESIVDKLYPRNYSQSLLANLGWENVWERVPRSAATLLDSLLWGKEYFELLAAFCRDIYFFHLRSSFCGFLLYSIGSLIHLCQESVIQVPQWRCLTVKIDVQNDGCHIDSAVKIGLRTT